VVESNASLPRNHIVRFYDNENNLVYSEKLSGVKLNTEKRRVRMKLKKILETAVVAYENKKDKSQKIADTALVSAVFR
jgi:aromatic ring-opening dioxygenase LigB subunit